MLFAASSASKLAGKSASLLAKAEFYEKGCRQIFKRDTFKVSPEVSFRVLWLTTSGPSDPFPRIVWPPPPTLPRKMGMSAAMPLEFNMRSGERADKCTISYHLQERRLTTDRLGKGQRTDGTTWKLEKS